MTKSSDKKPLVITEGKTDWQHLKKALERFQAKGIYTDLEIEFEEYKDIGVGESVLDSWLKTRAKSENDRVHIYIFDRDTDFTDNYKKNSFTKILDKAYENTLKEKLKKHYGCETSLKYKELEKNLDNGRYKEVDKEIKKALSGEDYNEWKRVSNNKVYVFCIPEIKNSDSPRTLDKICIEFYYKENNLKTTDANGKRLFFADEFEFNEKSINKKQKNDTGKCNKFISRCRKFKTKQRDIDQATKELTLISENVYKIDDAECEKSVLLSKNDFTKYIVNEVEGFDNFDIDNFRLIFDIIKKIIKEDNSHKKQTQSPPSSSNNAFEGKKVSHQLTATLGLDSLFIGREDRLKALDDDLTSSSLVLINGIGGVGKSAIASRYLQIKKDKFDYYGFFEGLDNFITALKVSLDLEKYDDPFYETLFFRLRKLTGSKLLVIDNLKDIEDHKATIDKILALKEHGYQILFTSREEIDSDTIASFYLDVLNLTDAKNLFKAIYPVPVEDELLLEDILGYLDCHTLFVELTAKTLKNKKTITLQGLKEKFDSGEFSKVSIKRKKSFGKYLSELFAIDQLGDDEEAKLVLRQLSILPSIEIPFHLLQTVFDPENNEGFEEILSLLSEKGWLIPSNNAYKLHQIIKEFILANHPPKFEVDVLPLVENLNTIEEKIELNYIVIIEIIATIVTKYLEKEHEKIIRLAEYLARIYFYLGEYYVAQPIFERLLIIRKKILGEEHPDTACSYDSLAGIYQLQGNTKKSLPLYQQALAIRKKILGEQDIATAISYSNLANYHGEENITEAFRLNEKALEIFQKIGEPLQIAISYANLAELYLSQKNIKEALHLNEKALAIKKEHLRENDPSIATSYNNLAACYRDQKKFEKALYLYKKSLVIYTKNWGEQHLDIAMVYNNLAACYSCQEKFKEALPLYKKALTIREKSLGKQHPDTQASYSNLIKLYESQADFSKALEIWKKLHKELSSTTLCEKLTHYHMELKNYQRAKYYAEQANTPVVKPLLKKIKWNIKKAKKLPPKRRDKYCKDS